MNDEQLEEILNSILSNTSDIQVVMNELDEIKKLLKQLLEQS